eukprot:scaffold2838_cov112-Cylindrotheca_fusiformis.AAC.1
MVKPQRTSSCLMGGKRTSSLVGYLIVALVFLFCTCTVLLLRMESKILQDEERRPQHPLLDFASPLRSLSEGETPYYLTGRTAKRYDSNQTYPEYRIFDSIDRSPIQTIPDSQNNWVLKSKLPKPTRNHDNIILDVESTGNHILIALFGRHAETIQWIDLMTGKQNYTVIEGQDPAGNALNNLHHVYSVVVDSLSTPSHKEIWLPCGFHGHHVDQERSSVYARIVHLNTMEVKTGPKLPFAGGACVGLPIHIKGPDEPAHICAFGGTDGQHDTGTFLPYTSCYDRKEQKWNHPFGRLPFGFDHGNAVHLPAGICDPSDPERILIANFRTEPYGSPHSEILAFDIPSSPWTDKQLASLGPETPGKWYVYANISFAGSDDEVNAPRDASGLVFANNWRNIVNFGGIRHFGHRQVRRKNGKLETAISTTMFSIVRMLDLCSKTFSEVGQLGMKNFALETSVSGKLNVAITCGGHTFTRKRRNSPWCLVNRIPGVQFQTNRGCTAKTNEEIAGVIFAD